MTLPTDVALRSSSYEGSTIARLATLESQWIYSWPEVGAAPFMEEASLLVDEEFDALVFNVLHGYYRQAISCLRNALETMMTAAALAVTNNRELFDRWRKGEERIGFRRARRWLRDSTEGTKIDGDIAPHSVFGDDDSSWTNSRYARLCSYAHSQGGYNNADFWESNGPIFVPGALSVVEQEFRETLALSYLLLRLGWPTYQPGPGPKAIVACRELAGKSTATSCAIMTVYRQVCPFHADEDIQGVLTGSGEGSLSFTCTRTRGHPQKGPHSWLYVPQPEGLSGIDGYAAELGLATELPAAIAQYRGHWIEYGVAERAYALQCPDDFTAIVSRYGHTAIRPKQYTASAFLASVLGVLSKHGSVLYHLGPATGRWEYNGTISWWAVPPTPDWGVIPPIVVRHRPGHVLRTRRGRPVAAVSGPLSASAGWRRTGRNSAPRRQCRSHRDDGCDQADQGRILRLCQLPPGESDTQGQRARYEGRNRARYRDGLLFSLRP